MTTSLLTLSEWVRAANDFCAMYDHACMPVIVFVCVFGVCGSGSGMIAMPSMDIQHRVK